MAVILLSRLPQVFFEAEDRGGVETGDDGHGGVEVFLFSTLGCDLNPLFHVFDAFSDAELEDNGPCHERA